MLTDPVWNPSPRLDLNQAKAALWIPNVFWRRVRLKDGVLDSVRGSRKLEKCEKWSISGRRSRK